MMRRLVSICLCCALILSGCASKDTSDINTESTSVNTTEENSATTSYVANEVTPELNDDTKSNDEGIAENKKETTNVDAIDSNDVTVEDVKFGGLDDPALIPYVENQIYSQLVSELDSEEYFVENVEAVYISKEYLAELSYNSQSNIYFGYTLDEIEAEFEGQRYMFTLGDDGQTVVVPLEEVYDDTYDQIIKNVSIGSGVILICVTVSVVSAGTGAPAVAMIFAASAQTGTIMALSSGGIGFVAASIARGYQTHDFNEAMKAGTLAASESYKWGAISGSVVGGGSEAIALKKATLNGLTMNEAAIIQKTTKWPVDAIKNIHSKAEFEIYQKAGVSPIQLSDGKWAFIREIDWNIVDEFGRTNAQRVAANLAPLDSTGMPYELHHIGQKADSPLAILTNAEHHAKENFNILHYAKEGKNVGDAEWAAQKHDFWQMILNLAQEAK